MAIFAIEEVSELDRRWSVCEKADYWRHLHCNWMDAHLAFFASRSIILNLVSLLAHCLASLGLLICPNLITPSIMWLHSKIRMYLFLVVSSEKTGKANGDDAFYWAKASNRFNLYYFHLPSSFDSSLRKIWCWIEFNADYLDRDNHKDPPTLAATSILLIVFCLLQNLWF